DLAQDAQQPSHRWEPARAQQPGNRRPRSGPLDIDTSPPRQLVELDDPRRALTQGAEGEIRGRTGDRALDDVTVDARRPRPGTTGDARFVLVVAVVLSSGSTAARR